MRRPIFALLAAMFVSGTAAAHEVWVEPTGKRMARIYLGEPDLPTPPGGEPAFPKFQKPVVFVGQPSQTASVVRRADHLEARLPANGDVRVRDDRIFPPWKAGEVMAGAIYYARGGRTDTQARLDLEIVPVRPGADQFVVMFRGKPLPEAKVRVLAPGRWQQTVTSDASGRISPPMLGRGRHILAVTHEADEMATLFDTKVGRLQHVSTLTFFR